MYITVKLLNNFSKFLTYKVPKHLIDKVQVGSLVQVPLQKRVESAMVQELLGSNDDFPFVVKDIDGLYQLPADCAYNAFVAQLAWLHQVSPIDIFSRVRQFLEQVEQEEVMQDIAEPGAVQSVTLTSEQQVAADAVTQSLFQEKHQTFVLHGVTGSGKTEVYKKILQETLALQKSAILMLPEVTLALQFERLLKATTALPIFGFHSSVTPKQKKLLWSHLLQGTPVVIIGVHLPVLLPISNLGIIIIDEEHEVGYQEKKHPSIHSKRAALLKAWHARIPVLLGSATPSIETLYNIEHKGWKLLELKNRFAGAFPAVQVVSLHDKKQRKNFWISTQLQYEIADRLEKKEQTIVFMNRRGFSFFIQCANCATIPTCTNCSVSLTLHHETQLLCHYCGYAQVFHDYCTACKKSEFLKKGIGTQQVVTILQQLFPAAVIARADADTTSKKKSWQETVQAMHEGRIDILVGTQSITKGYHFPGVTLVGVLWADINLSFPVYNAAETTLQQIIQVAGRAGRYATSSKVIIQTMADHPIYQFISEVDYMKFYEHELENRAKTLYPPVSHIAEIEVRCTDQQIVEQEADMLVQGMLEGNEKQVQILGPVPALIYRVQKTYCQKIFLKSNSRNALVQTFALCKTVSLVSTLSLTIDPV